MVSLRVTFGEIHVNLRYYGIDDRGAIFVADYLEASDLQAAIAHCDNIVRPENRGRVKRMEIWERETLLYQTRDEAFQIDISSFGD